MSEVLVAIVVVLIVTSEAYGPATKKALNTISERLIKISERVRALGE